MTASNIRTKTIVAALVATLAIGGVTASTAGASEQKALSNEEVYALTCGHLGTTCDDSAEAARERAARAKRKKQRAKRACSPAKRRAAKRAGRKALRKYDRRCRVSRKR